MDEANENEECNLNGVNREYSIEEVFHDYIGDFGKYQKLLSMYIWFIIAPLASSMLLSNLLILLIIPHSCKYDASNITVGNHSDLDSYFLPKKLDAIDFESCLMYNRSSEHSLQAILGNQTNETEKIKCTNGWNYDHDLLLESAVSENDWVCDEQWKALFPHSVSSIGMVFGSILVGILSDVIGRVSTIAIFFTIAGISGVVTTFSSNNYPLFLVCRILLGFGAPVFTVPVVLIAEFVGSEKRFISLVGFLLSFSTFNGLLPWIAHLIGNWRIFNLVTSCLYFLVPICSLFTYESPRWLMSARKKTKARSVLSKIARINGNVIPKIVMAKLKMPTLRSANISSIFKYKQLLLMFSLSSIIGFLYTMVYMSHNILVANLSKNPFTLLSIFACFDVFSAFLSRFLADYFGRRNSMIFSCLISAVLYASTVLIPKDLERLTLVSGLIARIGVSLMININGVYSSEIFPTVVRSRLVSARACFAALGTVLSPFLITYTFMGDNTPLFLYSIAILVSGLLMYFMPETLGKHLPETFEDADNLMKDRKLKSEPVKLTVTENEQIGLSLTSNSLKQPEN